jgi:hypothetical protein
MAIKPNQTQSDAIRDFPTACHVLGSYLMSDGNQAQSDAISDFPTACHVLGAHFGWSSPSQSVAIRPNHSQSVAIRRVLWMELSLAIISNQTQ